MIEVKEVFFSQTDLSFVLFVNRFTASPSYYFGERLSVLKVKSTQPFQTISFGNLAGVRAVECTRKRKVIKKWHIIFSK